MHEGHQKLILLGLGNHLRNIFCVHNFAVDVDLVNFHLASCKSTGLVGADFFSSAHNFSSFNLLNLDHLLVLQLSN